MRTRMPRGRSGRTALGGVLAAVSLALLWVAGVAPSGPMAVAVAMGLAALAGLGPVVAVLTAGRAAGYLCWAASGTLGLLLTPDKGIAALYLAFFGLYPVVKARLESMDRRWAEWALKLIYFNGVLTGFVALFQQLIFPVLPNWMTGLPVIYTQKESDRCGQEHDRLWPGRGDGKRLHHHGGAAFGE